MLFGRKQLSVSSGRGCIATTLGVILTAWGLALSRQARAVLILQPLLSGAILFVLGVGTTS